jgi:hypothetical protein
MNQPSWSQDGLRYGRTTSDHEYSTTPLIGYLIPVNSGYHVNIWNRTTGRYDGVDTPFPTKEDAQRYVEICWRLESAS